MKLLTTKEASELIGISTKLVRREVRDGRLLGFRANRRGDIRISSKAIEVWLSACRVDSDADRARRELQTWRLRGRIIDRLLKHAVSAPPNYLDGWRPGGALRRGL